MKTRIWTMTYEDMNGIIRTAKFRASSCDEAIDLLRGERIVGNLLGCWQGKTRYV